MGSRQLWTPGGNDKLWMKISFILALGWQRLRNRRQGWWEWQIHHLFLVVGR